MTLGSIRHHTFIRRPADAVWELVDVQLRTITRDGWMCSAYQPGFSHDGTEGELYDLVDDPLQQVNRWEDESMSSLRSDLLADLWDHQPRMHSPLRRVEAPV